MTSTPWDVGRDSQRDEDIDIEVPGQEDDIKDIPSDEREESQEVLHQSKGRHGMWSDTRMCRIHGVVEHGWKDQTQRTVRRKVPRDIDSQGRCQD